MPATGAKFNQKGNKKVIWLASAPSDSDAPTQAELAAGTDLTAHVDPSSFSGFSTTTSTSEIETLATTAVEKIADKISPDDSSMTFYKPYGQTTVWDLFARGTTGYVAICVDGLGSGKPSAIYPVEVLERTWVHGTGVQTFRVDFNITTASPNDDGTQGA